MSEPMQIRVYIRDLHGEEKNQYKRKYLKVLVIKLKRKTGPFGDKRKESKRNNQDEG